MPKKLLENASAEKEANDVGMRYMNSPDVMKDMRRDYGSAVDGIKVHDDSIANAKVTAAGRDGIASGKDIYMREGSLSSHAPEVNGLLAHEVTHIMQQNNSASQSAEYGSEQGGVFDFFRSIFKRKKPAAAETAKPAESKLLGTQVQSPDGGLQMASSDYRTQDGLLRAMQVGELSRNDPGQLAANTALQQKVVKGLVLGIGNKMNRGSGRKLDRGAEGYEAERSAELATALENTGEMHTFNTMINAMLPPDYLQELIRASGGDSAAAMDKIAADMQEGGALSAIGGLYGQTSDAFTSSRTLSDPEDSSAAMMNNLIRNTIVPGLSAMKDNEAAASLSTGLLGETSAMDAKPADRYKKGGFFQSVKSLFQTNFRKDSDRAFDASRGQSRAARITDSFQAFGHRSVNNMMSRWEKEARTKAFGPAAGQSYLEPLRAHKIAKGIDTDLDDTTQRKVNYGGVATADISDETNGISAQLFDILANYATGDKGLDYVGEMLEQVGDAKVFSELGIDPMAYVMQTMITSENARMVTGMATEGIRNDTRMAAVKNLMIGPTLDQKTPEEIAALNLPREVTELYAKYTEIKARIKDALARRQAG